MQPLITAEQSL